MATHDMDRELPIGIIGAGAAGLITAHTLLQDGFRAVQILTRDKSVGGVWARERTYPGIFINKYVHAQKLTYFATNCEPVFTANTIFPRLRCRHPRTQKRQVADYLALTCRITWKLLLTSSSLGRSNSKLRFWTCGGRNPREHGWSKLYVKGVVPP